MGQIGLRLGVDRVILLLALAGAGVDAVAIMGFNVLTAAQTGNTILLAVAVAEWRVAAGLAAAVSVLGYILGGALAEVLIVRHMRRHAHGWRTAPLLAEGILLAGMILLWRVVGPSPPTGSALALVALAAVAMGMQSAVVLRLHGGPTTTYITGMLTTFTAGTIGRWLAAGTAATPDSNPTNAAAGPGRTGGYGLTWLVYTAGAVACGVLFLRAGELALLIPIGAIVTVAACDSE